MGRGAVLNKLIFFLFLCTIPINYLKINYLTFCLSLCLKVHKVFQGLEY